MTSLSQSPRDRILWMLANNGGKMERSRLRASTGMRYAMLIPILEELVKKGRIKISLRKYGDIVSLVQHSKAGLPLYGDGDCPDRNVDQSHADAA